MRYQLRRATRHRLSTSSACVCLLAVALGLFSPAPGLCGGPLEDASEPPVIPIGPDAFTDWHRWASLRIGVRAGMKSTFDRTGGNHFADSGHYVRQVSLERNVVLDEVGPGILWFVRHNHWHGSPWQYRVDGNLTIVRESSTADPTRPVAGSVFLPERLFPGGLTWTWSVTKGADLSWVPIPFEKSIELAYTRTRYGTGYCIFWKLMPGMTHLSRPLQSWSADSTPPAAVLELLRQSGTDIAPRGEAVSERSGSLELAPYGARTVAVLDGPATLRRLAFEAPLEHAEALARCRLRIWWDGRAHPSVDAPLGLFFGTGSLLREPDQDHIVKAFPMTVRCPDGRRMLFATYFPMPFLERARIELSETGGESVEGARWSLRHEPYDGPANWVGQFHATYRDFPHPAAGEDLVLLDTRQAEGGGDWCGHFVGTTYLFTRTGTLDTLEGDPRFYFDDSRSPQAQGTGSEEWGGGGDYWGGRTMTLPFAGHPVGRPPQAARTALDRIHSAYRFLLSDLMPFGRNARITLEHGGHNTSKEHYETVTYWYGVNRPGLVLTDVLDVGNPQSEDEHAYRSPEATPPLELSSRFELGVDHVAVEGGWGQREVFPPVTDDGRRTRGASEFTLGLTPENVGVMLRRRLDLAYPNQKARVLVSDDTEPAAWKEAGTWYTAGGNRVVFADPLALPESEREGIHPELAPAATIVETSNRRWREDEFLVPRSLTEGRPRIRLRIEFQGADLPLTPDGQPQEELWTEFRYDCYCFVMPRVRGPYDWTEALADARTRALRAESRGESRSWGSRDDFETAARGDVVLDATNARVQGSFRVVDDEYASSSRALLVAGEGHEQPAAEPASHAEFTFDAAGGVEYRIYLRGKSSGGIHTDAAWLQFDEEIGTDNGRRIQYGFGNWRDAAPPKAYSWSSRLPGQPPVTLRFDRGGRHRLRLSARHTPFRLDQIWLATEQAEVPEFVVPVRQAEP